MLKTLLLILTSLLAISNSTPQGKFCGNVIGNILIVSLSKNTANISAEIFGNKMNCDKEPYNFTDNHIYFSGNPDDCLNTQLKKMNLCPCPPHILYKNHLLEIEDTPIGVIKLNSC